MLRVLIYSVCHVGLLQTTISNGPSEPMDAKTPEIHKEKNPFVTSLSGLNYSVFDVGLRQTNIPKGPSLLTKACQHIIDCNILKKIEFVTSKNNTGQVQKVIPMGLI